MPQEQSAEGVYGAEQYYKQIKIKHKDGEIVWENVYLRSDPYEDKKLEHLRHRIETESRTQRIIVVQERACVLRCVGPVRGRVCPYHRRVPA